MTKSIGVLFAALLFASFTAFGQDAGANAQTRQHPFGGPSMKERLNLTEQQQGQLRDLQFQYRKKQIQLRAKIQLARLETRELFSADKPDRSAIEKNVKAISDLQYQQKLDRIDHLFAVRNILTPDQLKIWKEGMGRRHMMMQRHPMGPQQRGMGGTHQMMHGSAAPGAPGSQLMMQHDSPEDPQGMMEEALPEDDLGGPEPGMF